MFKKINVKSLLNVENMRNIMYYIIKWIKVGKSGEFLEEVVICS